MCVCEKSESEKSGQCPSSVRHVLLIYSYITEVIPSEENRNVGVRLVVELLSQCFPMFTRSPSARPSNHGMNIVAHPIVELVLLDAGYTDTRNTPFRKCD